MSVVVKNIYKSAIFKITSNIAEDLTKQISKDLKDKYKGSNNGQGKVLIEAKGKEKIMIASEDASRILEVIMVIGSILDKHKSIYKVTYGVTVKTLINKNEDEEKIASDTFDAFDAINKIHKMEIKNAEVILSLNSRYVIYYNGEDYVVETSIKTSNELHIVIDKETDGIAQCNIYEELINVYYNTLYLSLAV